MVFFFSGCDNGNGTSDANGGDENGGDETPPDNPTPVLTSISPTSKVQHLPAFTLTATGTDFVDGAKIFFDGAEKETTFVSSTELTCTIEPEDITETTAANAYAPIGILDTDVNVLVNNPTPGGGDSGETTFTIRSRHSFETFQEVDSASVPEIAVDSQGNIYIVYEDGTYNNGVWRFDVYIVSSSDGGETWSDPVNVSNTPGRSFFPAVAVETSGNTSQSGETSVSDTQDTVYVIWNDDSGRGQRDFEVNIRSSTDGGATWSNRDEISHSGGKGHDNSVIDIAVGGDDTVYVVWSDDRNSKYGEIFFTKAAGGSSLGAQGLSWTTPKKIAAEQSPRISVDGSNNLYVVCEFYGSKLWDIAFTYSTDAGQNWENQQNVSNASDYDLDPDITTDSQGIVHIVWQDLGSPNWSDVIYIHSTTAVTAETNSLSWISPVYLSDTPKYAEYPRLVSDAADNINLVWSDSSDHLYFIRSINGGDTWTQKVSIYEDYCNENAIAVDKEGNIYVVTDSWDGIFIKSKHWD